MDSVRVGNIQIDADRLAQIDGSYVTASIKREDFISGEIAQQRVCKRPFLLSLIAVALLLFGLLTARGIVNWLIRGGTVYDVSIMMVLFYPAGLIFLYQAWRTAPMVIIQTRHGVTRMEFKGNPSKHSIKDLELAAREHGYALSRRPGERE